MTSVLPTTKRCPSCGETKHRSEYNRAIRADGSVGLQSSCRECGKARNRASRARQRALKDLHRRLDALPRPLHVTCIVQVIGSQDNPCPGWVTAKTVEEAKYLITYMEQEHERE